MQFTKTIYQDGNLSVSKADSRRYVIHREIGGRISEYVSVSPEELLSMVKGVNPRAKEIERDKKTVFDNLIQFDLLDIIVYMSTIISHATYDPDFHNLIEGRLRTYYKGAVPERATYADIEELLRGIKEHMYSDGGEECSAILAIQRECEECLAYRERTVSASD